MFFCESYDPSTAAREAIAMCCEAGYRVPEFDSIVVTGVSGVIGAMVAQALGKKLLVVRKPGVPTRSRFCAGSPRESFPLVGEIGGRFIIVDDEIYSGNTVKTIISTIGDNFYCHCGSELAYDPCEDADCSTCDYLECSDRRDSEGNLVNAPEPEPYPVFVGLLTVKPYKAPKPWRTFGYMWSPELLASQFGIRCEWSGTKPRK